MQAGIRDTRRGVRGGKKIKYIKTTKKKQTKSRESKEPTPTVKIFNVSSHRLNEAELSVLSKSLSFCLISEIDYFQLFVDLNTYICKLTQARHFAIL